MINKAIILCFTVLLSGCIATSGTRGWPIQTYTQTCEVGMIPFEPHCLFSGSAEGGFRYKDEFSACRQSLTNYTNTLDDFYRCSNDKLTNIFNTLLKQVRETGNCYEDHFKTNGFENNIMNCPQVAVPRFSSPYQTSGLEPRLGVPFCVTENQTPLNEYFFITCQEKIDIFLDKKIIKSTLGAASAQQQYDYYMKSLKSVLDHKSNSAISKFNCIAQGNKYCM